MEEKKKRFRPTTTAYRALESEVLELRKLVDADLAAQVKQLRTDLAEMESSRVPMCTYEEALQEKRSLEQSNKLLEDEVKRLREQVKGATDDYHKARREVLWLRDRNIWQRLVNADYKE